MADPLRLGDPLLRPAQGLQPGIFCPDIGTYMCRLAAMPACWQPLAPSPEKTSLKQRRYTIQPHFRRPEFNPSMPIMESHIGYNPLDLVRHQNPGDFAAGGKFQCVPHPFRHTGVPN